MVKRAFSMLIATAVLGIALVRSELPGGIAQAETGAGIRIVDYKLPNAEITTTGRGYSPKRNLSPAQKRLLAQRAATIDAYRVMVATLSGISGCVVKGSGYIRVSGYVKGATVTQVREFADGKVEVDLTLPVILKGKEVRTWDKIIADINRKGYPVHYLRQPEKQISEEEWLELIEKEG